MTRQVPKSWHTSNGSFQTKGRAEVNLKFSEYSNSKQIMVTPDVVEYDGKKLAKPAFDLILGMNTLRELGIVLDFWTKTITVDEITSPMRNINKLSTKSRIEQAWTVNNMLHEPESTEEATQHALGILDAKYEKADLQVVVNENCAHLSVHDRNKLLELLTEFEKSLMVRWLTGKLSLSPLT